MQISDEKLLKIMAEIGVRFPTFGGGIVKRQNLNNPIANAMKDRPLCFAAGVKVDDVVRLVASML